ncbi:cation diffusion facilitator family transporter [Myxococcota bacterium]|nr:cation diffusion facilitator family transporter [Myxococcota bacterium]
MKRPSYVLLGRGCLLSHDHAHQHGHSHGHSHGHAHGHGHSHGHAHGTASATWAIGLSLLFNGIFLFVEVAVGLVTGSLALLSDAAHMLSDVGALALALAAARLALRPAEGTRTFGMRRAEVVGGFVNGLTLVGACAFIVWEAVERLRQGPPDVPGLPVLVVGGLGLALNLGSAWALSRADSGNLNVRGALVHMLADALGSVGAMVAAGLVMAGIPAADPVVSLFIAGLVLWGTVGLLRDTGRVLLQFPPPGFDVEGMCLALEAVPGVASVHDAHVWTLDGQGAIVSVHLVARAGADLEAVRAAAVRSLEHDHGVRHATLQVEGAEAPPCEVRDCTRRVARA